MAWDPISDDLYSGDVPMDAWGGAMSRVAALLTERIQRKPRLPEVVDVFGQVLAAAPARRLSPGPSRSLDWLRAAAVGPEVEPPADERLLTGQVVSVPYDPDGRAVIGLVLYGAEIKGREGAPGLGPCVVVLDLEASELRDLDEVRSAPWLLRPFHPGSRQDWPRLGRVAIEPDPAVLPLLAAWESPSGTQRSYDGCFAPPEWPRVLRDYFGQVVPSSPEAEARVISQSVGGFYGVSVSIRHLRGLCRSLPWCDYQLPAQADRTPLLSAGWGPLRPYPAKRKRGKPPRELDLALRAEMAEVFTQALRGCSGAWGDRWDRAPKVEEMAYALRIVLSASPEDYLADPGRIPDPPPRPAEPPPDPSTWKPELSVHQGMERCVLSGPRSWTAFLAEVETGELVVDTSSAPARALVVDALGRLVLPAWYAWKGRAVPAQARVLLRSLEAGDPVSLDLPLRLESAG